MIFTAPAILTRLAFRFEQKFIPEPNTGCWIWTADVNHKGYGRFWIADKNYQAHRISHELYKGQIPHGFDVDHTCHNNSDCTGGDNCFHRRCVNPAHLEAVTRKININRGNGVRQISACLKHKHPLSGNNLYVSPAGRRQCRTCNLENKRNRARKWQLSKLQQF